MEPVAGSLRNQWPLSPGIPGRLAAEYAVESAEAEKITRSFVNRLLRLTLLAPDIQDAVLDGRHAKGMQLEDLTRSLPMRWEEQREWYLDA